MSSLSLSDLLQQEGVFVESVGTSTARPLFKHVASLGGQLKQASAQLLFVTGLAVAALSPNTSFAFGEFQPKEAVAVNRDEGTFKMDLSALNSKTTEVSHAKKQEQKVSAPASAWPKFKSSKDVEAYFLDPEQGNNLFAALATRMENLVTTVYPDPAKGRNVGIGYNMDAIGLGQAKQDLERVGMKKEHVQILMSKNEAQYSKVHLTPNQSVALLLLVQPRYEAVARDWIGATHWQKMDANQRAAISYLAYQTGGNIEQFKNAKHAIQSGKDAQAQKHLVTYYQDGQGEWQRNDRFAKHVGNMWQSPQAYAAHVGQTQTAAKWNSAGKTQALSSPSEASPPDALGDLISTLQKPTQPPNPENQLDALGKKLKSMFGEATPAARSPNPRP